MPLSLPARPSLEWLKKTAKDTLTQLRAEKPSAVLAEAQLLLARDYGFDSWRKIKRHVEERERTLAANDGAGPALTRDLIVHEFLIEGVTWFEFQGSSCARRSLEVAS